MTDINGYVLAVDQGTTSSRAIVFDAAFTVRGVGQQEFPQHFPKSGWVEHNAEDLIETTLATVKSALAAAEITAADLAAVGITNQRETTVVWDRATGRAVHNAIVWQDRRTADFCRTLKDGGAEAEVTAKTGLLLDPYFSATKLAWLLDNVSGARARAEKGELAFGTVDSWLIWRLTGGRRHVTDATNASRTMLYDIHKGAWSPDLLSLFNIPESMLPEVLDSADNFGETDPALFGCAVPIRGVAGDQQAATVGQACFRPGMIKSTYGTGCFALLNTGARAAVSKHRLLTTIAYRLNGVTTYALESAIFSAGTAVQWLRDGLGVIQSAAESGGMAAKADPEQSVYLVPAFTGLGAPHWDPDARGALYGLTRATGPNELAKAALESVCFQTADLIGAMRADGGVAPGGGGGESGGDVLRVDGGMVASDWTMQRLSDLLDAAVDRPQVLETTALGAAWLAGHHAGVWPDADGFAAAWRLERRFEPAMNAETRGRALSGWRNAVQRTLSGAGG
ncbi:MAG: glycerol kinase GlpK [Rhodospirillales bacterium]